MRKPGVRVVIHMRKATLSPLVANGARLVRPRAPSALVSRGRLNDMLDHGVARSATVVCAGPGWGKTTLVSSWAAVRSSSGPIAWLSLDPQHNDPRAFWSDLILALRTAGAIPGTGPLAELDVPAPVTDGFRHRIAAAIDDLPAPVVLVLDDLQEVHDPAVLDGLTDLLSDPPGRLRLVLLSRTQPALPLHRFRASGDLVEIRAADLAFRAPEVAELIALHDHLPPADDLTTLLVETEGWPAGLGLAADSVAGFLAGDREAVADYLIREVIAGQPATIRRFLLRTSITDRISGELAGALTGDAHGKRILERLYRANAFVVRSEAEPGWFRYHRLLRDVLRHELELEKRAAVPELHLLAAQWYAGERLLREALAHAAAARDWPFLGRMVVGQALPLLVSADRAALTDVLDQIPPEQYTATAELALCAAILLYRSGALAAIPEQIARTRAMLADRADADSTDPTLGLTLRLLEIGAVLRVRGDMAELTVAATEVLQQLTTLRLDRVPSLRQYRAVALTHKGIGLLWSDRLDQADRYLWAAWSAARIGRVELIEIDSLAHLALLVFLHGSIREAEEYVVGALQIARRLGQPEVAQSAAAHLTLALIEIERDRVPEAQESLRQSLHAMGESPEPALAAVSALVRASLLLARDEPVAARALLRRAGREPGSGLVAPLLDRWTRRTEAEIDLALGDPHAVVARIHVPAAGEAMPPVEQVLLARAHLMIGDYADAEDLAARVRQGPDRMAAVAAWIVTALVADAQGHGNRSVDALSEAVLRADLEGVRRPFRRFDARRISALTERSQWLGGERVPAARPEPRRPAGPPVDTDVLSARETEVLRYLPTILTAGEIGANLGISVNTVKAHMRSIYRKLGAVRRREVVVLARQRGLL
jgi:LuxR family maltose regulon positive regulatory protein